MRSKISELNLFKFAKIIKPHGYKGEVVLKLEIDFERIKKTELIFVETDGIKVPFFIIENSFKAFKKNTAVIKLDSIETESDVKKIVNHSVYIEEEYVSEEEKDTFEDIIGFDVYNDNVFIGIADAYLNIPSNPILQVITDNKKEILIPFTDDFIIRIDKKEKGIYFILPEGLIEIGD